jgi:hypothetical protein
MSMRAAATTSCLTVSIWLTVAAACANEDMAAQLPEDLARAELSVDRTGTLQTPTDPDERSASIAPPVPVDERPVRETPAAVAPPAPAPVATAVPADLLALNGTVSARVNELRACRREIATSRHVSPGDVAADRLLLRWTIQPGGEVTDTEVVAEKQTDPDVLSCAKRMMLGWVFVRAPGGEPLRIEQELQF